MKRLRMVVVVMAIMTATVIVPPGSAVAATRTGPLDVCPGGNVCIFDSDAGYGWAFASGGYDSNLGLAPGISGFNDKMDVWWNNSGRRYCWYWADRYGVRSFIMEPYGGTRAVYLKSSERNNASSIRPC